MTEIRWKSGSSFPVAPDKAHAEIERLRKREGGAIVAATIVAAAKAKNNPLHRAFEWDDALAAEAHRLEEARRMMRSLVVVESGSKRPPQRVYETVELQRSGAEPQRLSFAYSSVSDILRDPEARAELLRRALRELMAFRARFRHLQELATVLRSIDELVETQ